jgi:hypothetical protein
VQEGDGAQPGVGRSGWAGVAERGADGAEQDAQHVAGEARVMRQEGADPLRQGEHPLADGQRRQDVVGEVGGHLDHAAGIAGGADAAALAGEGDEALGGCTRRSGCGRSRGRGCRSGGRRGSRPRPSATRHRRRDPPRRRRPGRSRGGAGPGDRGAWRWDRGGGRRRRGRRTAAAAVPAVAGRDREARPNRRCGSTRAWA